MKTAVCRYGQMAIPVVGQRLFRRNFIFGEITFPAGSLVFVGVVLQADFQVLFTAAAQNIDMAGSLAE